MQLNIFKSHKSLNMMKKLFIILLFILILGIGFYMADTPISFIDSTLAKNFTGIGLWTNLTYLKIPKTATIYNASINLTGLLYYDGTAIINVSQDTETSYSNGSYCYQCEKSVDEDLDTFSYNQGGNTATIYINYTIPENVSSVIWQYKTATISGQGYRTGYCLNQNDNSWVQVFGLSNTQIDGLINSSTVNSSCIGTNLQFKVTLASQVGKFAVFYEEQINMSQSVGNNPQNVSLDVSNDGDLEFNHRLNFTTENITNDFKQEIIDYLATCTAVNYSCNLPLNLTAYNGRVLLNSININYSEFPRIQVIYPVNNSNYTNNQLNVNYTLEDSNMSNCWWTDNYGLTNNTISCWSNLTTKTWSDGFHNVTIYANDSSNNINSSSISFNTDATAPNLVLLFPEDLAEISYNTSIPLNLSVSDGFAGVSTCYYNLDNGVNTTLTACANTTFNTSEGTHTVYLYSNDTYNNTATDSATFTVSLTAPAITLNYPSNKTYFNNKSNIYFNYTATDSNGLSVCELWGDWTGVWHKNYTWSGPASGLMNSTFLTVPEGSFKWNIFCNDTTNAGRFSNTNFTFITDETLPSLNINLITTNAGSQTITFTNTITDTNLDTTKCKYTILNSSGSVDGLNNNISFTCNSGTSATVSAYGTYNLQILASDLANNLNTDLDLFTTSANASIIITGGGGGGSSPETSTVAIVQPSNVTIYNALSRAILYARIRENCNNVTNCRLDDEKVNILIGELKDQDVTITISDFDKFLEGYNNNNLESVKIFDTEVTKYNLYTGVLTFLGSEFKVTPSKLDPFVTFILFNYQFTYPVKSNKELKNASLISGDPDLSIKIITSTLAEVKLNISESNYNSKVYTGIANYIDNDGNSVFQEINLRVINLRSRTTLIVSIVVLIIIIISFIYGRKSIKKLFKDGKNQ